MLPFLYQGIFLISKEKYVKISIQGLSDTAH